MQDYNIEGFDMNEALRNPKTDNEIAYAVIVSLVNENIESEQQRMSYRLEVPNGSISFTVQLDEFEDSSGVFRFDSTGQPFLAVDKQASAQRTIN